MRWATCHRSTWSVPRNEVEGAWCLSDVVCIGVFVFWCVFAVGLEGEVFFSFSLSLSSSPLQISLLLRISEHAHTPRILFCTGNTATVVIVSFLVFFFSLSFPAGVFTCFFLLTCDRGTEKKKYVSCHYASVFFFVFFSTRVFVCSFNAPR